MDDIILNVPIDDGGQTWLAVQTDVPEDGLDLVADGLRGRIASFSLVSAMDNVMPAIDTIIKRVRSGRMAPDEVALELGLKIGGEHGVILTKGTAEANLKVTVKWQSARLLASAAETEAEEDPQKPEKA